MDQGQISCPGRKANRNIDDQAKAAYRRRLSELHEGLEEAKELGNVDRAELAEQEIDALTRELSRAVGLGGRTGGDTTLPRMLMDRAAPGDREKARTLLVDALENYTRIGMPRHIEMTQALLD